MSDDSRWLSPNAPTITNAQGGSQSDTKYAFTELDPHAMFVLAEILYTGRAKYGKNNWRKIPVEDHINHALVHINAYIAGDTQDDHLGHAFCRMMFAVAMEKVKPTTRKAACDKVYNGWCYEHCCNGRTIDNCEPCK